MSHYHVIQLKHLGAGSLIEDLQALRTQFDSNTTGAALVGIFTGLFGLASDECLLITKQLLYYNLLDRLFNSYVGSNWKSISFNDTFILYFTFNTSL